MDAQAVVLINRLNIRSLNSWQELLHGPCADGRPTYGCMYALHEKHLPQHGHPSRAVLPQVTSHLTLGQAVHLTVLMLASMGMPCDILAMKAQPSPVDLLLLLLPMIWTVFRFALSKPCRHLGWLAKGLTRFFIHAMLYVTVRRPLMLLATSGPRSCARQTLMVTASPTGRSWETQAAQ